MKGKNLIITVVVVLLVGAGSFYGGMMYQQSKTGNGFNGAMMGQIPGSGNAQGQFSRNNGQTNTSSQIGQPGGMGNGVSGEITNMDDKSLTITTRNGGSKIVFFSDSTTISKMTDGTTSDLKTGETVMVTGETNSDGSVTAKSIDLRNIGNQPTPSN